MCTHDDLREVDLNPEAAIEDYESGWRCEGCRAIFRHLEVVPRLTPDQVTTLLEAETEKLDFCLKEEGVRVYHFCYPPDWDRVDLLVTPLGGRYVTGDCC